MRPENPLNRGYPGGVTSAPQSGKSCSTARRWRRSRPIPWPPQVDLSKLERTDFLRHRPTRMSREVGRYCCKSLEARWGQLFQDHTGIPRKNIWGPLKRARTPPTTSPAAWRRPWSVLSHHAGSHVDFRGPQFSDFCNRIGHKQPSSRMVSLCERITPARSRLV
jgi:hypothetical protein